MGRPRFRLAGVFIAIALLAGGACSSMGRSKNWQGRKLSEAIAEFGTPSQILPAENGQKYYVWRIHHQGIIPRTELNSAGQPVERDMRYDSIVTWTFLVDKDGTILSFARSAT